MDSDNKKKLSDKIYDDIKQKIMLNHFRAGDMLSEAMLADQYHVSRTPIRQALQKLADRGLVTIQDGVGTFVTFITYENVHNAYEVRREIEKIAIRTAIYKITEHELMDLEDQFLTLKKQFSKGGYGASLDKIVSADWALHDLIVNRSDNIYLSHVLEEVNYVLRRFQYANASTFVRAIDEHLHIIDLIRENKLDEVVNALDLHIRFQPI